MNEETPRVIDAGTGEPVAAEGGLAVAADVLPGELLLLPLPDRPFFPAQTLPIVVEEAPWLETIQGVGETPQRVLGLVRVATARPDAAGPGEFAAVGTVARIHRPMRAEGKIQFIAEGLRRFRIRRLLAERPPYRAQVDYPEEPAGGEETELRAYAVAIIEAIKELLPLNPLYSEELKYFLNRFGPNEPSALADFAAAITTAPPEELQQVLETLPLLERMRRVLVLVRKELEVARLQAQIRKQVEEKLGEQQRRFFLREQLKVIQQELGLAKDDRTAEIERFRARLEGLELTDEARSRVEEELDKLAVLELGSPEYAVTRNYLDWVTALPWGRRSEDRLDLAAARRILDRDHEGLEDVKERIVEFLAVGALRGEVTGSILLLVGPPGVGKTSIGRSIAEALGRGFFRFSVGGMRDEAEIKGHRRTYIGAMPGKIIQALRRTGTANPVLMLDEIDKIGASYQGDPAAALLEVLDPEQNQAFLDHYLDLRFDLSSVLFVCTANQLDTLPGPLLDRMEILRIPGYLTEEKVRIARRHLWPRQLARAGVPAGRLRISNGAIRAIVEGYAREAGVRGLDKRLGRIVRKAVVRLVEDEGAGPIRVRAADIEDWLGPRPFREARHRLAPGVAVGLAWTPLGGATLSIEATRVHGRARGLRLTGKLGEVMRESAEIAYSYVVAHADALGVPAGWFDSAFIHLHVPAGATPKDGPSAGITMATALLSLARGRRMARGLAMTGELTLTGEVLPVGGIREKVLAARRAGMRAVILPQANRGEWEELPAHLREGLEVHFVRRYPEVAALAFAAP
ncbi:endopeptidase La [Inmirania thermothiophila]|uniref:Lon protease n=1 Tax=Inmirania thermothiophila TaxID=1750597 RepID=A0A3N1Y243_9GAMM|nr:endopeptidase La [Inmirania thermothiophila]ROR32591.1 ATP dependent PIM1 peptidase [Inmirania thermothiophila]